MFNHHKGQFLAQWQVHDDYMTRKVAWEYVKGYIPKDKVLWEAFYGGDGDSGRYLEELGFKVIHEPIDFFKHDKGDIVVTNPAFSKAKETLARLAELDKPFMLILPTAKLTTRYMARYFGNKGLQIIIPPRRLQFDRWTDGKKDEIQHNRCSFDCFYYCYKLNLPRDIIHL